MSRKLRFDLDVQSNALLCPNPQEFYSKAYVSENVQDNFRLLAGIKHETKIANVLFTDVTKAASCNFTAGSQPLDAKDIDVCSLSAMAEICRFDLETSFLALQMAQGSNGSFEVASFMSYYWDELAKQIGSEIATLRWQGNTSLTSGYLQHCDGLEKKLSASGSGVVKVTAASITSGNVLAQMVAVHAALPAAVQHKTSDLRFYVSSNVAAAYQYAAAAGNTMTYVTRPLDLTFLGIKVVICEGMSNNRMVLTLKDNLIYAFDGLDDDKALKAINLEDTTADALLRTRVNYKIGFHFVNPAEIVFYYA
jgi:hypothetical protein